jgi:hypothetical protein
MLCAANPYAQQASTRYCVWEVDSAGRRKRLRQFGYRGGLLLSKNLNFGINLDSCLAKRMSSLSVQHLYEITINLLEETSCGDNDFIDSAGKDEKTGHEWEWNGERSEEVLKVC